MKLHMASSARKKQTARKTTRGTTKKVTRKSVTKKTKARPAAAKKSPAKKKARKKVQKAAASKTRSKRTTANKATAKKSKTKASADSASVELDVAEIDSVGDLVDDAEVVAKPSAAASKTKKTANSKYANNPRTPSVPRTVKPAPKVVDIEMDSEVLRFIDAIDKYKQEYSRPFPSWREVYYVFKKLGYELAK